jgi:hypothetical protein
MTLQNIINGELRAATEQRDTGEWVLPVTPPHEAAFALKAIHRPLPVDLAATVAALGAIGREAAWIDDAQLREIAGKTGSPIKYMRFAVARVNRWLATLPDYLARLGTIDGNGALVRDGSVRVGGLTATIVLAGDDITVAPWMLGQALLAGANCLVKPSSVEPLSAFLFVKAAVAKGLKQLNLVHLDSSNDADREVIAKAIQTTDQSVVLGEDATVGKIYGPLPFLPTHKAIPYWSGRSGVLVFPDADLEAAAKAIVFGATEDRGNRCISTKKVFAPRAGAERLEKLLVAEADRLHRGSPLDDATDLGTLDPAARAVAESASADAERFYEKDMILARAADRSRLVCEEVPYPAVGIRYYDAEDPVALANAAVKDGPSKRALVVSVFTASDATYARAAADLRAYKVLRNLPTSHLDLASAHQGMHLCLELMRVKEVH